MIFMLDNYDSFTYNLVQYLAEMKAEVVVARNDETTPEAILALKPAGIVISPGPGTPADAGIAKDLIRAAAGKVPLLGVCLGHQALAEVYGGKVVRADRLMHGKTSPILHDGGDVFKNLPSPFTATRYHSLIVSREDFPDVLEVSAWTAEKEIMGLRHKTHALWGVQFHPESILTDTGKDLIRNFLALTTVQEDARC